MNNDQRHEDIRDDHSNKEKEVKIEVDSKHKKVLPGTYVVSKFKDLVDVPADKDLDQVINGTLTTLSDNASIIIKGGEVFFSHVRRGEAS
jgi:hypothetical protein